MISKELSDKYDNLEPRYRRTKAEMESGVNADWFEIKRRYVQAQSNARTRGILWEITLTVYIAIMEHPCTYGGKGKKDGIRMTLDRINNDLGYLPTNVIPACWFHNYQRNCNWTHEAFLDIMAHYPTECRNRSSNEEREARKLAQ